MFGTTILSEGILDGVPFPTGSCRVPGSYRTVIFNGDFCDHSTAAPEYPIRNERYSPSNLTFVNGLTVFISEALNDHPLFSARNKWRSQQIMDEGLIMHVRRSRTANFDSRFDAPDEGREFSSIRYGINHSTLKIVSLSFFREKPIIIQNEKIGPHSVRARSAMLVLRRVARKRPMVDTLRSAVKTAIRSCSTTSRRRHLAA
jgi:hypothetical protein